MNQVNELKAAARDILAASLKASLELFKVMVPVLVAVRLLQSLGLIKYLALPLKPVMELVGLPADMGLVWATGLFNNIYSAIIVFLSLARDHPLSAAQATVLGTMILIAHSMPVELGIAKRSGPRLMFQAASRLGGAFAAGWALNAGYRALGLLQGPAAILFKAEPGADTDPGHLSWALDQIWNLSLIFVIIVALLAVMSALKKIGAIGLMDRLLRPLLKLIGIGPKASAITVIGLTLGISYGGGLIIREARSGALDRRDVFYSLTLMGLCHSLIEDTMLLMMIGGHLSGLLWARLIFALAAVALLVRVSAALPQRFCDRFLWAEAGGNPRAAP
ncbi:MAG: hypothetical protein PHV85_04375 [Desulfovibrionaceae bacterium]|nr:hypothetical protein [Desulfovibrionaceae bacterium]